MTDPIHNAFFCFADTATIPNDGLTYIEAIAAKTYNTPAYGPVEITDQKIDNFITNFHTNSRGQEIAINYDHGVDVAKGNKAAGWIRDAKKRDGKLVLGVEFTEPAKAELKNKEWRYFSLEWEDEWMHPDGQKFTDVMVGGGLTNRPIAKGLMPINFSEIFVESADVTITDESKELEHSEPGTGSPPVPRTDEDGSDDLASGGGWRRDTPPVADPNNPAYDPDQAELAVKLGERIRQGEPLTADWIRETFGTPKIGEPKGGKAVPFELSDKVANELLRTLELPVDASGDDVLEAAKLKFGELSVLKKEQDKTEQEKKFAEQYPDMYADHRKLMAENRGVAATKFSESVSKIRKQEGLGLVETRLGLSSLAKSKIEEVHVKFAEGTADIADFEDAIKAVTNGGLLEFGEIGSNRDGDDVPMFDTNTPSGIAASKKAFSELMQKAMRENKIGPDEALTLVTEKYPELAKASQTAVPG